jgi:hypothetical protein
LCTQLCTKRPGRGLAVSNVIPIRPQGVNPATDDDIEAVEAAQAANGCLRPQTVRLVEDETGTTIGS